jgi:hypothetical protein
VLREGRELTELRPRRVRRLANDLPDIAAAYRAWRNDGAPPVLGV